MATFWLKENIFSIRTENLVNSKENIARRGSELPKETNEKMDEESEKNEEIKSESSLDDVLLGSDSGTIEICSPESSKSKLFAKRNESNSAVKGSPRPDSIYNLVFNDIEV